MTVGTNFFTAQTANINVALTDGNSNAILISCTVATLPTTSGYAVGCLALTEAGIPYCNTGTTTTASFVKVSST